MPVEDAAALGAVTPDAGAERWVRFVVAVSDEPNTPTPFGSGCVARVHLMAEYGPIL